MGGKGWSPKVDYYLVEEKILAGIAESIQAQKMLTHYDGPDEGWHDFVANKAWDAQDYYFIGWNSGILQQFLEIADDLQIHVPAQLERQAQHFVYVLGWGP